MAKEKQCLVTTGLIGGVDWFSTAPDTIIKPDRGGDGVTTWKQKAKQDLIAMLSREPGVFSEEAKQGIEFEKRVYQYANTPENIPANYTQTFRDICNELKGFQFYKKGGINVTIDGENCYVYGKYDAIRPDEEIKDLKTTKEYKQNKYLNGIQHKIYCYISKIVYFEYIIAEWDVFPKIKKVYKEIYEVANFDDLEKEIHKVVKETFDVIKELELWDLYREKFCLY